MAGAKGEGGARRQKEEEGGVGGKEKQLYRVMFIEKVKDHAIEESIVRQ